VAIGLATRASIAEKDGSALNGKTRTYYVAADEIEWDYAPSGKDLMMDMPFDEFGKIFTEPGPHRIGRVYRKAVYREYTDHTFAHLQPRPPQWQHLGILGPVLRAEVGDTIKVVFKNNTTRPLTIHPHGVFYQKDSEGSPYNDRAARDNAAVAPGATHVYNWPVPERAGPGPGDPSSVVWLYHSHVDEQKDVNSGLIGTMIITARGKAKPNGVPSDVDREFVTLFIAIDENQSWYLQHNVDTYAGDPKGVDIGELDPHAPDGSESPIIGRGFGDANHKFVINGFLYANLPMMTMKKGERVRWYLVNLGDSFTFHTPHWHGNTVIHNRRRTDVIALSPADMEVADMVPDNPGIWLFHCHVSDHMRSGMSARYEVLP
jgi:FtsP/CotA-like multicopper oxidase with cupredoxin domain